MADPKENQVISFWSPNLTATVFFGTVGLAAVLLGFMLSSLELRLGWICIGLMLLGVSMSCLFGRGYGAFRLDDEGIQQLHWFYKPRYLRWEDVVRVMWCWHTCSLEGKDTTISIRWVAPKPVCSQAQTFIESALSPQFDLSVKPVRQWSFEPNVRSFLGWLSKIMGISIAGTALFFAGYVILVFLHASRWMVAAWIALIPLGCIYLLGGRTSESQINPIWRLRRNEERPR